MPRASLSTQHPAVVDLKSAAGSLLKHCETGTLDLVELGKALEQVVREAHNVVQASGRTSRRFEAAEHALDLKTPKSALDEFIDSATQRGLAE